MTQPIYRLVATIGAGQPRWLYGQYCIGVGASSQGPSMPLISWPHIAPILLLIGSNVFMTIAWYGHLRFKSSPLMLAILVSWGIAFVEYCMAVPANRLGNEVYSTAQLKTMQEVITLVVFAIFSILYLKESLTWNHAVGFMLIAAGAGFVFYGRN
jgi:uncharacterized protein